MPLISRRGGAAARGFGLFGRQRVLTTFTFPAGTSNWTAPGGVTSLVSAVGKGSDGVSDYTYSGSILWSVGNVQALPLGEINSSVPHDWSEWYSPAQSAVNTMNTGSGISTIALRYFPYNNFRIYADGINYRQYAVGDTGAQTFDYVKGSASLQVSNWPSSGTITPAAVAGGSFISILFTGFGYGYSGSATSGFALSFSGGGYSGGTGTPASNTTYNNVSVTPGTTYTIVNNGVLTITYFV
jgi:hypothetical protein